MKNVNNAFTPVQRSNTISNVVNEQPAAQAIRSADEMITTSLRMPAGLRKRAKQYALAHEVTLTDLVANALEEYMTNHQ